MRKLQPVFYSAAIGFNLLVVTPAVANCNDMVGRLDYFQPAMERLWQELQAQTDYPWGTVRPYGELNGDRIVLNPVFDALSGVQKNQVVDLLELGYGGGLYDFLTPAERERPGIGAVPPYSVFNHDSRLLAAAYDGCTPMRMLTERDRYSYYNHVLPYNPETNSYASLEDLRNAGQPFWRDVQFPIAAADERAIRLSFWNAVGYDKASQDWWIAWVPEQGHFEINVAENYDESDLQRFWRVAPDQYRYEVMTTEGTPILER